MATTPWVAGLYNELVSQPAPPARSAALPLLEFYDRRTLLPPLPPGAEHYYADLFAYKSYDARAQFQQLLEDWTRPWIRAPLPPVAGDLYEDLAGSKNADARARLQQLLDEETRRELLPTVPFVRDEWEWFVAGAARGLAALVPMDDFVNAPSGSGPFGQAPSGRSVRLGFSIAAFR